MNSIYKYSIFFYLVFIIIQLSAQDFYEYNFNNSFTEENNIGPALNTLGVGDFRNDNVFGCNRTVYHFNQNSGLQFNNSTASNYLSGSYTIEMFFKFEALNSWKRIVDFKNRQSDWGLYGYNGAVNFYNIMTSTSAPFYVNQYCHILVTRDVLTNQFVVYVDGVSYASFYDNSSHAVIGNDNVLNFFQDDLQVQNEASAGNIAMLRLYNRVLTPDEVANNFSGLTVNLGNDLTLCQGESATISPGNDFVTYLWQDGTTNSDFTVTSPGTYAVTVQNQYNCQNSDELIVNYVPNPIVNLGNDTSVCPGLPLILDAENPGATYLWNNNATTQEINVETPGTYVVTVTNSGICAKTDSIEISACQNIEVFIGNDTSVCEGELITLDAENIGADYLWSTGETTQSIIASEEGEYSVTVTNIQGLTASDNIEISYYPQPVYNSIADTNICEGETINISLNPNNEYIWSTGCHCSSLLLTPLSSGTYSFTATNLHDCSDIHSFDVGLIEMPEATIFGADSICAGDSVLLSTTGHNNSFQWLNHENIIVSNAQSLWISPESTQTYTLIKGSQNRCYDTTTTSVFVAPLPVVNITAPDTVCYGGEFQMQATGGISYSWETENQLNSQNVSNPIVHGIISDVITVEVVNQYSCSAKDSTIVTVLDSIVINYETINTCPGTCEGQINTTISGGTGIYFYNWNSGEQSNNLQSLCPGYYSLQINDSYGCTASYSMEVFTFDSINYSINYDSVSCYGFADAEININTGNNYNYHWNTGNNQNSLNNLSAGVYTITVTDENQCTKIDSVEITQPQQIQTNIDIENVLCYGGSTGQILTSVTGGIPPYTYHWNDNNSSQNRINISAGNYILTLTDANGCTKEEQANVLQPDSLSIETIALQNLLCYNDNTGQIQVLAQGGIGNYTYLWNNNLNQALINNLPAGNYSLTVNDENNCTKSKTFTLTQPDSLTIGYNIDEIKCFGDSSGSIHAFVNGGTQPYSFEWSNNKHDTYINNLISGEYTLSITDANNCYKTITTYLTEPNELIIDVPNQIDLCFGQSQNVNINALGGIEPYTYLWNESLSTGSENVNTNQTNTCYVLDSNACKSNVEFVNVSVSPELQLDINLLSDTVCPESKVEVNLSISGGIESNYLLYENDENIISPGVKTYFPNDSRFITYTLTDGCSSPIKDSVKLNVYPHIIPEFNVSNPSGCEPHSVFFNIQTNTNLIEDIKWSFGNNMCSFSHNTNHLYETAGNYDVLIEISDIHGCESKRLKEDYIHVYPKPEARFSFEKEPVSPLSQEIVFNNYSDKADYFSWNFGDGEISYEKHPIHHYKTGTYHVSLIAETIHECKDTAEITIKAETTPAFYAPTAFTPDGDGNNDYFKLFISNISEFKMIIYNRWGEPVYTSNDSSRSWDGNVNNEKVESGIYVWTVKYADNNGVSRVKTGNVTLLR